MKKVIGEGKKKIVAIAATGVIAMGALGGGAYAYQDAWTAQIQKGAEAVAGYVFKGEIEAAVTSHGDVKEKELKGWANQMISGIVSELNEFKKEEINRGKKAIDDKVSYDKKRIESEVNKAINTEKNEQKASTNETVQNAKNDLDAVVESYLDQIPQ
jgi:hypothetical protein